MLLPSFPFSVTDWAQVEPPPHAPPRSHGVATWRTQHFGDIRVRMVDTGYVAHHWCEKGRSEGGLCIAGELTRAGWPVNEMSFAVVRIVG